MVEGESLIPGGNGVGPNCNALPYQPIVDMLVDGVVVSAMGTGWGDSGSLAFPDGAWISPELGPGVHTIAMTLGCAVSTPSDWYYSSGGYLRLERIKV
ncbi:MAG TPA: hypothetical protein VEJ87_01945 [Acidimicrobiales bacterium]|nr:hypothetical protein [Acidimicrobiales bacterium]